MAPHAARPVPAELTPVLPASSNSGGSQGGRLSVLSEGSRAVAWEAPIEAAGSTTSQRQQPARIDDLGPPKDRSAFWDFKPAKEHALSLTRLRQALQQSRWYHHRSANALRVGIKSNYTQGFMLVGLVLALFMNDMWRICGINDNIGVDATLSLVMFCFTIEFIVTSMIDASYFCSFFFLMDVVGTVSMVFDISYMLGESHTEPSLMSNGSGPTQSFVVVKAARTAKLGARMGRLSRVIRVLRYLPFLGKDEVSIEDSAGIASVISARLSNLLGIRVSLLCIILVMVMPIFELWTFPAADHSMFTWVDRLSVTLSEGDMEALAKELSMMSNFYSYRAYGPFTGCAGQRSSDGNIFNCNHSVVLNWSPQLTEPTRHGSIRLVSGAYIMLGFNMYSPDAMESGMSVCTVLFIVLTMVFSSLVLSNVVTELAVQPLQKMLRKLRQIASTVFQMTANVSSNVDEDDNLVDIDDSTEMKLLEKVVKKLAVIVNLQKSQDPVVDENLQNEDIGVLTLMRGRNFGSQEQLNRPKPRKADPRQAYLASKDGLRLEDFGLTTEQYYSFGFHTLKLSRYQRQKVVAYTILNFPDCGQCLLAGAEGEGTLQRFLIAIEKEYLPNPFHNYAHAVDVVHGVARVMRLTQATYFLSDVEQFSLLIAAVAHDLGHPGVNNSFLLEVGHDLALQYNDSSPLENMHCAKLYTLVGNQAANVFSTLSIEDFREARKTCIEAILHTDMMMHQAMVKDLDMLFQMNSEIFRLGKQKADEAKAHGKSGVAPNEELDFFGLPANKLTIIDMLLHFADVSNPCRVWEVSHAWAMVCLEEFFAQGDQEKVLGIPVQFLNDRVKLNQPNSQIGFIEFMIAPFVNANIRLFPQLFEYGRNLVDNLASWEEMWAVETTPSDEDRQKALARVKAVHEKLELAMTRAEIAS